MFVFLFGVFLVFIIGIWFNIDLIIRNCAIICLLCIVGLTLFLLIPYIESLCKLYRDSNDDKVTYIITKTTILAIISIFFSFFDAISDLMKQNGDHITYGLHSFFLQMDTFTNFMCIMLSHSIFNNHYHALCGSIHNKCKVTNLIKSNTNNTVLKIDTVSDDNDTELTSNTSMYIYVTSTTDSYIQTKIMKKQ